MTEWNLRNFRNDLSVFIGLIEYEKNNNDLRGDFDELKNVHNDLLNKSLVEYILNPICFNIYKGTRGIQPDSISLYKITCDSMLMVTDPYETQKDPLHGYKLDLKIDGFPNTNTTKTHSCSWHHDRDKNGQNSRLTHPLYHLQFGGRNMELIDNQLMVLSSPRIPHPPMDIFLLFHFIINNFYDKRIFEFVNNLMGNHDYISIIKRAQKRLWEPYFNAFSIDNSIHTFSLKYLFPLYIN